MRKFLLTGMIICLGFTTIYSQQIEQKNIKGVAYIKRKDNWVIKSTKSNKTFLVNEDIITLKLKGGRSIAKERMIRKNKLGYIDIQVPKSVGIMDYYERLKEEYGQEIESIDINYYAELGFSPNDTQLNNQWYLDRIHAKQAWDITLGRYSVTVAVIDYCFNWAHNDIGRGTDTYENVWLNSGEDRWTNLNNPTTGNGIDDDSNSFVDDLKGWDFRNNDNDVRGTADHGTRVSGIIGAKTNNRRGMAGIAGGNNAEGIKIMGLNVGYDSGLVDMAVVDDAIIYAVDNGARVINMSFGGEDEVPAVNDAINYAVQNNVVVVACSMNEGYNFVYYPASHPNVIAVGGTDKNNRRASFAQYGQNLDVVAPAIDIYSTALNNGYNSQDGTSFSAPQVSGIAALILSVRPDLTGQQVRNAIEQTARKVGGYSYATTSGRPNGTWNQEMGYGLVDAHAAVYAVAPRLSGPTSVCDQATYTVENLPPGATVQWSASNNSIALVSGQNTGTAVFRWTMNGGSQIRATIIRDNQEIPLVPLDVYAGRPVILRIIGPDAVINSQGAEYEAELIGASGATAYEWILNPPRGNSVYPSGRFVRINFYDTGIYQLICRATNNCGAGDYVAHTVYVYNQQNPYFSAFSLSPNPATDVVTVQLNEAAAPQTSQGLGKAAVWPSGVCEIQLWSATSMLRSYKTDRPVFEIPVSELPAGIYFVRIIDKDGKIYTEKLIKK